MRSSLFVFFSLLLENDSFIERYAITSEIKLKRVCARGVLLNSRSRFIYPGAQIYIPFYHVDKPVVEVVMDPETPVNEADRVNVSLTCEVDAGNPATLSAVRWYLDGDLLKELPDCPRNSTAMTASTEESSTFCDIDPSKLLLESVGRSFHGNYSCEGRNEAGWGPISPSTPVIVYCKSSLSYVTHSCCAVMEKLAIRNTHYVFDHNSLRPSYSCYEIPMISIKVI